MGILVTAKKLVEAQLATLSPALPIAWEAVKFDAPADGSKYIACNFVVNSPSDPTLGDSYYRENAALNVYVIDQLGIGTSGALTTAEAIRALFAKKTTLQDGTVRVLVLTTPYISSSVIASSRLVIPIRIELTIENL